MSDADKAGSSLEAELARLRQQVAQLETSQAEYRQLEAHYQSLLNSALGFVIYRNQVMPDSRARVIVVSPSIRDVMGVADPHNFESWFENIHPDDLPRVKQANADSIRQNIPFDEQMRIFHPGHATWRSIHAISYPVVDTADGQTYFDGIIVDVSAQKQAEQKIQESEARYRTLYSETPVPMFTWEYRDGKFTITHTNRAAQELSRGNAALFIGKSASEIYPDRADIIENMRTCLESQSTIRQDTSYLARGTQEQRHVIFTYGFAPPNQVIMFADDITDRRQAEKNLREHEAWLQLAVQSAEVGLWDWDLRTNRVYYSPEWKHQIGYEDHEISNDFEEWRSRVHPDDLARAQGTVQAYLEKPWPNFENEFRFRHKDGSYRWILARANLQRDNQGRPYRMLGSHIDVTARRQAEDALLHYNRRLHVLRQIDRAIVAAHSPVEIAEAALPQLVKIVPCTRADVSMYDAGEGILAKVASYPPGSSEFGVGVRLPVKQTLLDIEALSAGTPHQIADYQTMPRIPAQLKEILAEQGIRSSVVMPLITMGKLVGTLGFGRQQPGYFSSDELEVIFEVANQLAIAIHQTRLLDQIQLYTAELEQRVADRTAELSAANAKLARATRLKDEFLASMSHELRTPLNAILGMAEILQTRVYGDINPEQLKAVTLIGESGQHLLALINDILDLSKIEAGELHLNLAPVEVESMCMACLRFVNREASQKRIETSLSFKTPVQTIMADERRLKQILVNLLSNAVKFTPDGGRIGIEVDGDAAHTVAHFTVWDTGIGIAEDDVEQLFKPFVQIDSRLSRQHEGTGLGLALVAHLAEIHGGGVSLTSEVGRGSRFTVSLPWRMPKPPDQPPLPLPDPARHVAPPAALSPDDQPPLILLVEDNEANIAMLQDFLQSCGYRVLVAREGTMVVRLATENRPGLILMDVQVPGIDGLEATRRLRAEPQFAGTPIIGLTALAMPGDRERCLEAGMNDYLSKPVSLASLHDVIDSFLPAPPAK